MAYCTDLINLAPELGGMAGGFENDDPSWNDPRCTRICHFFYQGRCKFGASCRNIHVTDHSRGQAVQPQNPQPLAATSGAQQANCAEGNPQKLPLTFAEAHNVKKTKALDSAGLCPLFVKNASCNNQDSCTSIHGVYCEFCAKFCLHPYDKQQRRNHLLNCMKQQPPSDDTTCGICLEAMGLDNLTANRSFGILPNCSHCFCLLCIRKWRDGSPEGNMSCPLCRVVSDFVCPSMHWVETKKEKDLLIGNYMLWLIEVKDGDVAPPATRTNPMNQEQPARVNPRSGRNQTIPPVTPAPQPRQTLSAPVAPALQPMPAHQQPRYYPAHQQRGGYQHAHNAVYITNYNHHPY